MTPTSRIFIVTTLLTASHSFAPAGRKLRRPSTISSLSSHRRLPGNSNNNNDNNYSNANANNNNNSNSNSNSKPAWLENAEYWAERETLEQLNAKGKGRGSQHRNKTPAPGIGDHIGGRRLDRNAWNDGGNTFAHLYNTKSTDQFKLPFEEQPDIVARMHTQQAPHLPQSTRDITPHAGVPQWFGANTRNIEQGMPAINAQDTHGKHLQRSALTQPYEDATHRHAFQTSTTDDFKRPYGMPDNNRETLKLTHSPQTKIFKAPFQTSSTDDFKRSSDAASGVGAPQQPIYAALSQPPNNNNQRNSAWQNTVGQDSYESTQLPNMRPLGGQVSQKPSYHTNPSQSSAILTELEHRNTDVMARNYGRGMLLHRIKWTLKKDPPGDSPEFPLLLTSVSITLLATLSTRHLHLCNGFSPVLASSAITFLISTCIDRRLGQAALCGSLAGMSASHLAPNANVAVALGTVTSLCYEILIRRTNLCPGIGGRVGAAAFLATSIVAKYRRVAAVGRKIRRGIWKVGVGPSNILVSMLLFHVVGAVATILLRESSSETSGAAADPVTASSVVGLLGSLFIRDNTSLLALYGGSFVGMSLPSRLIDGNAPGNARTRKPQTATSLVTSFAAAAAFAGLIHAITIHNGYCNGGWGGKVGLCAFAGCWMYRAFDNILRLAKERT